MMKEYLKALLNEKNICEETSFEVDGNLGTNFISVGVIVENIIATSKKEQKQIKTILTKIDFMNGDILHFFKHLAKAIAI